MGNKVYCIACSHCVEKVCTLEKYCETYEIDNWYEKSTIIHRFGKPEEINKNNDCNDFEAIK